jgi:pimeloyl-ACP methyl ester carboxylesterase
MAPTLHFIHGFNSSHYSFAYLAKELGAVSNIDYKSYQPLEKSVLDVGLHLPHKEPVILIGHSLGGVLAMMLALKGQHNVQGVVTISSPLGGSKAASLTRWFMNLPILNDITPSSDAMKLFKSKPAPCSVLSIISTGGHLPAAGEANDSIVSVQSQSALKYAQKVEIPANHFEILMHDQTIEAVRAFTQT